MSMPHPASHPEKPRVQTFFVPWEIKGRHAVQAATATEAELKFQMLPPEAYAASGDLSNDPPEPAEDAP